MCTAFMTVFSCSGPLSDRAQICLPQARNPPLAVQNATETSIVWAVGLSARRADGESAPRRRHERRSDSSHRAPGNCSVHGRARDDAAGTRHVARDGRSRRGGTAALSGHGGAQRVHGARLVAVGDNRGRVFVGAAGDVSRVAVPVAPRALLDERLRQRLFCMRHGVPCFMTHPMRDDWILDPALTARWTGGTWRISVVKWNLRGSRAHPLGCLLPALWTRS